MLEDVYFLGDPSFKKRKKLKVLLKLIGITSGYGMDSEHRIYFIENEQVRSHSLDARDAIGVMANRKITLVSEIYDTVYKMVCERFPYQPWFDIDIGDTVTIADRIGNAFDYPLGFVDYLAKHAGESFVVSDIIPFYIGELSKYRKTLRWNEDPSCYLLEGLNDSVAHSSMFLQNTEPIKKIVLADVPFIEKLTL